MSWRVKEQGPPFGHVVVGAVHSGTQDKGINASYRPRFSKAILGAFRDLWCPGEELLLWHLPAQTYDTGQIRQRMEQKEG